MKPVIYVCRLIGIAPFTYTIDEGKSKTDFHFPSLLWCLTIHLTYIISTITVIIYGESITNVYKFSPFFKYGDYFRIHMGLCCIVYLSVSSFLQKNKYSKILELLNGVHFLFETMKTQVNYSIIKTKIILAIFISIFFHCLYVSINILLVNWSKKYPSLSLMITLYFPTVVSIFTYMILNVLNHMMINYFSVLNSEIKKIIKKNNHSPMNKTMDNAKNMNRFNIAPENDSSIMKKICVFWKIYDKICDTCDCTNEVFSSKLLLILTGSFVLFVFNEYQVLCSISTITLSDEYYPVMFFSMHQALISSSISIVMINFCNKCKEMVNILLKVFVFC